MPNLCFNLNKSESLEMWLDISKFLTIAIIVHLLLFAVDDYGELFNEQILKIFLYLIIALVIYHLIVRKFIIKKMSIKNKTGKKKSSTKKIDL